MESNDGFRKLCTSATVFYTNFGFGCAINFISPVVIAFSQKFHTDVTSVSFVFTILTVSYLLAALTSAFVYRYVNRHVCIIALVSIISMAVLLLPHVTSISIFYLLGALMGLGAGGCDTAQITWIIELWREKSAPYILTQHFTYSLGTMLPSLILSQYLKEPDPLTSVPSSDINYIPFTIAGCLMTSTALGHLVLFFYLQKTEQISPDRESLLEPSSSTQEVKSMGVTKRTIFLVILSCCVIGFYQGLEMTTMQFFPTFCVYSHLDLSQAKGAQLLFGLTLTFAIGRGLGILIVLKMAPHLILWVNFTLILTANLILYLLGQGSMTWLWVGSCLLGIGMSTVYPAFYAYIQRHLHITNFIVAFMTVSGGAVAGLYPAVVGAYIQGNPSVLNYVIFCSVTVSSISFGIIRWMTKMPREGLEFL